MIDDKKIEEAASAYGTSNGYSVIGPDGRISLKPELETAFEAGIHWAINEFLKNLWHDPKKEPKDNRNILIEHKCGDLHYYTENYDCYYEDPWDYRVRILNITRWLYLDDLFPKEGDNYD